MWPPPPRPSLDWVVGCQRAVHMESAFTARYQKLIRMMEAFVSEEGTSMLAVREMEAEFRLSLGREA